MAFSRIREEVFLLRWHEVTIHTTEEATEAISNFIHELGAGGVSIEESGTLNKPRDTSLGQWYELPLNDIPEGQAVIKGYFSEGTDVEAVYEQIKQFTVSLSEFGLDPGQPVFGLTEVDDEDWANAWKQYFKPLKVSDRLTIKPTWEEYEPSSPEELILELDPGMAFGTGTHATTALCLRTLEKVVQPGDDVIDVGTGSGVLAIAAAKLGANHVLALDLDPVAVSSASENTKLNGMEDRITVKLSDLLQVLNEAKAEQSGQASDASTGSLGVKLPVRVVVANILAEIIVLFVKDVYDVLESGGKYVVSGVIASKRELVEAKLVETGFTIDEVTEEQDWVVITASKAGGQG